MDGPSPAVALHHICKRFPGVVANDDISLAFLPGEIHVLLGENGAGKSTLMAILAGMLQPDDGRIEVRGVGEQIASPRESLRLGIGTVFQHVLLVPSLSVIENLMLGASWWSRQDRTAVISRFRELSETLVIDIDPDVPVENLSLGEQQQVEIMRALWRGENVLILDEPTSMLTPQGVRELGEVMRRLRDKGVAIIFITHKLKEAYELGDRISVLRLGRLVGQIEKDRRQAMTEQDVTSEVIQLMFDTGSGHDQDAETLFGEARGRSHGPRIDRGDPPLLILSDVSTEAEAGATALHAVDLAVWPGEVFGIAGVDGNGQKHLAEALAGQRPLRAGHIQLQDQDITGLGVVARRRLGIRYVTDERVGEGTVPSHSVATNLLMKEIGSPPHWQNGITRWSRVFHHARQTIDRHDIRTPSERTPIGRLSGGNIQKTLLARELTDGSCLVIFNKPTHGLDLHNTQLARERIRAGAGPSVATIVISTELDELLELCDRVGVMYQGTLRGIVENKPGAEEQIGLLMTGADAA